MVLLENVDNNTVNENTTNGDTLAVVSVKPQQKRKKRKETLVFDRMIGQLRKTEHDMDTSRSTTPSVQDLHDESSSSQHDDTCSAPLFVLSVEEEGKEEERKERSILVEEKEKLPNKDVVPTEEAIIASFPLSGVDTSTIVEEDDEKEEDLLSFEETTTTSSSCRSLLPPTTIADQSSVSIFSMAGELLGSPALVSQCPHVSRGRTRITSMGKRQACTMGNRFIELLSGNTQCMQSGSILSGRLCVWILQHDGSTQKTMYSVSESITIPPYTPFLLEIMQDNSVVVQSRTCRSEKDEYSFEPYNLVVEETQLACVQTQKAASSSWLTSTNTTTTWQDLMKPSSQLLWTTSLCVGASLGYWLGQRRRK